MRRNDVLNTPNLISLSRLALAGVFLGVHNAEWRVAVVFSAMASDVLDGVIARVSRSTTKLGALIDPIADRVFMLAAFVAALSPGAATQVNSQESLRLIVTHTAPPLVPNSVRVCPGTSSRITKFSEHEAD